MKNIFLACIALIACAGYCAADDPTALLEKYKDRDFREMKKTEKYEITKYLAGILPSTNQGLFAPVFVFEQYYVWRVDPDNSHKQYVVFWVGRHTNIKDPTCRIAFHLINEAGKLVRSDWFQTSMTRVEKAILRNDNQTKNPGIEVEGLSWDTRKQMTYELSDGKVVPMKRESK
jgi:hypothetical protein